MVKKTTSKNQLDHKSRISELEENYKRVLADYQNQERRHKEQESFVIKMANASLIEKILLNIDSLYLAQSHLNDPGLKMVISQLMDTLKGEGLAEIKTNNQPFDPLTMDCVEVVTGEKDVVVETVSPGYYLFDKVLRPAKVKVGSGQSK